MESSRSPGEHEWGGGIPCCTQHPTPSYSRLCMLHSMNALPMSHVSTLPCPLHIIYSYQYSPILFISTVHGPVCIPACPTQAHIHTHAHTHHSHPPALISITYIYMPAPPCYTHLYASHPNEQGSDEARGKDACPSSSPKSSLAQASGIRLDFGSLSCASTRLLLVGDVLGLR